MYGITEHLYYGGIELAGDSAQLKANGIDHIIPLTFKSPEGGYPEQAQIHQFSMRDGPRNDEPCSEMQSRRSSNSSNRMPAYWFIARLGGVGQSAWQPRPSPEQSRVRSRKPSNAFVPVAL